MFFSLLEVLDGEPGYLRPPEAAGRNHGVVAFGTQAHHRTRQEDACPGQQSTNFRCAFRVSLRP